MLRINLFELLTDRFKPFHVIERRQCAGLVELQVENGFYYSWWQRVRHPMLQQLRSEPRFVKVEQQLDEMQAQQRENVRRMEAEGKL